MAEQNASEYEVLAEAAKSLDGRVWAQHFLSITEQMPRTEITEDFLETWFCNAIIAGYDAGCQSIKE
jgi:hypothetical protein